MVSCNGAASPCLRKYSKQLLTKNPSAAIFCLNIRFCTTLPKEYATDYPSEDYKAPPV